jgi:parvulin-like peptidyl-prolyl isomerase
MIKTNKLAAAILAVLTGITLHAKVIDASVATVNGEPITASEYNTYLETVIEQYKINAPQALERPYATDILGKEVLNGLISNKLVYQAAKEAKITVKESELNEEINAVKNNFSIDETTGKPDPKGADKRFNAALKKQGLTQKSFEKKLSEEIAARKLMEQKVQEKVKPVEEADVKALYANVEAYLKNNTKKIKALEKDEPKGAQEAAAIAAKLKQLTGEQVLIGHIYLAVTKDMPAADIKKKEELAKKIKKEIDGGMDFSAAVKTYTEDKQALASGGDMILIKGVAPKEIDAKAFSLSVGKVSDPIKTDVGYHIIKIKEKRAEKPVTYDDISRNLAQYIAQSRVQEVIANYIKELYDKADVKVTKEFEVDKVIAQQQAAQAQSQNDKETTK